MKKKLHLKKTAMAVRHTDSAKKTSGEKKGKEALGEQQVRGPRSCRGKKKKKKKKKRKEKKKKKNPRGQLKLT